MTLQVNIWRSSKLPEEEVWGLDLSVWLDLLFPRPGRCTLCHSGSVVEGGPICANCFQEIASWKDEFEVCQTCGRLLPFNSACLECGQMLPPFLSARAVGPYRGIFKRTVQDLKFRSRKELAYPLGRLMAEVVLKCGWSWDWVLPVPLDQLRLAERGFNQAELLAEGIARELRSPLLKDVLLKSRSTRAQLSLDRAKRLANLQGAFNVSAAEKIEGKKLLLVDDVLTTGSTAKECTTSLLRAGAVEVRVITWATGVQES